MKVETLAEDGKRLEVALRYVVQLNNELKRENAKKEDQMAECKNIIEDYQRLNIMSVPNEAALERTCESLGKDIETLRHGRREKIRERNKLYRSRDYTNFQELRVALFDRRLKSKKLTRKGDV